MICLIASKNMVDIADLKDFMKMELYMKDLGNARKVLGMEITRYLANGIRTVAQNGYIKWVMKFVSMGNLKPYNISIATHFKLLSKHHPNNEQDREEAWVIPYSNVVGSLMYVMIFSRENLTHAAKLVSQYTGNPGYQHGQVVKYILKYLRGTNNICMRFSYRKTRCEMELFVMLIQSLSRMEIEGYL